MSEFTCGSVFEGGDETITGSRDEQTCWREHEWRSRIQTRTLVTGLSGGPQWRASVTGLAGMGLAGMGSSHEAANWN